MSRADRLLALVQFLSGARRRTLVEITRELEPSADSVDVHIVYDASIVLLHAGRSAR